MLYCSRGFILRSTRVVWGGQGYAVNTRTSTIVLSDLRVPCQGHWQHWGNPQWTNQNCVQYRGCLYKSGGPEQRTKTGSKGSGNWQILILVYSVFLFKMSHLPFGARKKSEEFVENPSECRTTSTGTIPLQTLRRGSVKACSLLQ